MIKHSKINGIDTIKLVNNDISMVILPQIGGLIYEIRHIPTDTQFLYHHYKKPEIFGNINGSYKMDDFLNSIFTGGYFEVLPNAGYKSIYRGITFGLHDETTYLPWEYDISKNTVCLNRTLLKYPLKISKIISLENSVITIREKLENLSNEKLYFSWLHHPTCGGNFFEEYTILDLPDSKIEVDNSLDNPSSQLKAGDKGQWPIIMDKSGKQVNLSTYPPRNQYNSNDLIYVPNVKKGYFKLGNTRRNVSIEGYWDNNIFRSLWIWRPLGGGSGYPWYGTIYATAIEMTTSYPAMGLQEQVNRGTAMKIEGYESINTEIRYKINNHA